VAAELRQALGVEPAMVHGRYGEFAVLVDGEKLVDGGPLVWLGVLPSPGEVVAAVRERLGRG
jgi:hypothetical protein